MELAVLKGTEKQVNWAKAIRKDRLKIWQAADPDGFQGVESLLNGQAVSSWWISNKDKSLREIRGQLQGGAKPMATTRKAPPAAPLQAARKVIGEEVWKRVATATGFRRAGLTRDQVTGEVVQDASLPF
jgi:hypothetical protein